MKLIVHNRYFKIRKMRAYSLADLALRSKALHWNEFTQTQKDRSALHMPNLNEAPIGEGSRDGQRCHFFQRGRESQYDVFDLAAMAAPKLRFLVNR